MRPFTHLPGSAPRPPGAEGVAQAVPENTIERPSLDHDGRLARVEATTRCTSLLSALMIQIPDVFPLSQPLQTTAIRVPSGRERGIAVGRAAIGVQAGLKSYGPPQRASVTCDAYSANPQVPSTV